MGDERPYTAEDGLRLLDYLGLAGSLSRDQIAMFRDNWPDGEIGPDGLIKATRIAYKPIHGGSVASHLAGRTLSDHVRKSGLRTHLREGNPLEDILPPLDPDYL